MPTQHAKVTQALKECFDKVVFGAGTLGFKVRRPEFDSAIDVPGTKPPTAPGNPHPKPKEAFERRLDPNFVDPTTNKAMPGDPDVWDGEHGKHKEKDPVLNNCVLVGIAATAAASVNGHKEVLSADIVWAIDQVRPLCKPITPGNKAKGIRALWFYCDY